MRTTLFLAADYANITREGKLNVMGIFDDIYASVASNASTSPGISQRVCGICGKID